jgi:glucose/arabinose dehydrogenase
MKKLLLSISFVFYSCWFYGQIGSINLTPEISLNLEAVQIEVPLKYSTQFPSNRIIYLPNGFKARLFYTSSIFSKPRFMSFSPKGVLHIADYNTGNVIAMPDYDDDGVADTGIIVANGLGNIHDVKFFNGAMYVTQERKVFKCVDANDDGFFEDITTFIDTIAEGATQPGGGHRTRTIIFDSLNSKIYLSIGSYCNVCRETYRAIIEEYNIDGSGKRIFATGVRNAVGMALHPKSNRLWANNNGSDNQGNGIPPEWVDLVRDGGFYGYPFAHSNQVWFDFNKGNDYMALKPITEADSNLVSSMKEPAGLIQAHSAPMAMQFLNESMPSLLKNGFLMALRGSWNSSIFHGYKIVYMDLSDENDTTVNYVADFCSGFLTDSLNGVRWARPVGLALDGNGNIYVGSDDINRFVIQIYQDKVNDLKDEQYPFRGLKIQPNPATEFINAIFEGGIENENAYLNLLDVTGRVVRSLKLNMGKGLNSRQFNLAGLDNGVYFIELDAAGSKRVVKFTKQ